jgi:hypothetical protein
MNADGESALDVEMDTTSTDALLSKMRQEDYSRFNRSIMLIKLESIADKNKIITNWTRLFGLNFKHLKNIKF